MYIREKSGSSLKGRHFETGIWPMNWKPSNQKVEMGGACSPIWDRERIQLVTVAKNTWEFSSLFTPQSQRSSCFADTWL